MNLTLMQLQRIMPHAGGDLNIFVQPLNLAMKEFGIDTPVRVASFLAQVGHESGSFRYMEEIASGSAYDDRADLGNTDPEAIIVAHKNGTTPGRFWKGHGPIQITGYHNHRTCGEALGMDLVEYPIILTMPLHGCRGAAWFWDSRNLNALADSGQQERLRRRVNGGLNGFADVMAYLERATEVLV